MRKKGFTLIELLAVIVILGVLMAIAVPNTLKMLERNKKKSFVNDSLKFLSLVKYEIVKNKNINLPRNNDQATIINLAYLNSGDLEVSPFGTNYNKLQSFVAITYNNGEYQYYVTLYACGKGNEGLQGGCAPGQEVRYVEFLTYDELSGNSAYQNVKLSIGGNPYLLQNPGGSPPVKVNLLLLQQLKAAVKKNTGMTSAIIDTQENANNEAEDAPIKRFLK